MLGKQRLDGCNLDLVSQDGLRAGGPLRGPSGRALESLATAIATRRQRVVAAGLCTVLTGISVAALPVAHHAMPPIPGFLALNQGALTLVFLLTTWLFLAQYRHTRAVSLLLLGAGSLYTALAVMFQLLCTPNMLTQGILIGEGAPTLTWLWNAWHLGTPLFALPYAIMEGDGRSRITPLNRVGFAIGATVAGIGVAFGLTCFLACNALEYLPVVADADGGYRALTTSGVGPGLIALNIMSLAILCWTTKLRSVLQLWLGVSLFFLLLDNFVTDTGAMRMTAGWLLGRAEALLAGFVVLGVYLTEVNNLYRRAESAAILEEGLRVEAQAARANLEIALEASGMCDWELELASDRCRRTLRHDRLFGYTVLQPEWGLRRFLQHVTAEDSEAAQSAFEAARRTGRLQLECRIRRVDDHAVRWLSLQGRTSYDKAGNPGAMAGCLLDVTERRQTEERLRQAERMEAVGQLTGGVAHDFNNLLTIILGNLDLIVRKTGDAERVERLARNALVAGRRGTELTDKLLAFSRRQIVEPQTVNLNRVIAEFQPLIQQAVGETVRLLLDLDAGLDPARLDQSQFQAVLLNLAGNARDAMPSGGTLCVRTSNVLLSGEDAAGFTDARPGEYLRVVVEDSGVGMDANTVVRAFEPFFTTKEVGKGTGLGLSQVYGFVRQAGGHCRVSSAPGEGCSVELYLPRSADQARSPSVPSNVVPLRTATGGEVVLVVEDEDALREMAAESLEQLGYRVLTAPDARVALEVLRGPTRIDALFSDVVMPGGMNGAQLAMQARAIRPDLKVLLTSGYIATATGGSRELPEGVPLLRKPYMREDLAAKLRTVMAS